MADSKTTTLNNADLARLACIARGVKLGTMRIIQSVKLISVTRIVVENDDSDGVDELQSAWRVAGALSRNHNLTGYESIRAIMDACQIDGSGGDVRTALTGRDADSVAKRISLDFVGVENKPLSDDACRDWMDIVRFSHRG